LTQEAAGLGEQALNKIAEVALASQLEEAERLEVRIKTDLSKLAHGEVDSITIKIYGLVRQQNLRMEELQLQINHVTVKPLSALMGKIKLTQPSKGTVRIVISEDNLTCVFNSKSFYERLYPMQGSIGDQRGAICIQQLKCYLLADGYIAFNTDLTLGKSGQVQSVAFTVTPRIATDGQGVVLQDVHSTEGKQPPPELTAALAVQMSEVLNLHDFEQKGISLQIQRLEVTAGKLTLQAAAYIEQFSSS